MAVEQRDYYEVLNVPRDADQRTIKEAFRKLAMKYHPDRNKAPDAEERFKEIAEAYAILSDPQKRAKYDSGGFKGVAGFGTEDLFRDIDFGDIFSDMGFGFGLDGLGDFFAGRSRGPARGRDIDIQLRVGLDLINNGGEELVRLAHPMRCQNCDGTGVAPGTEPRKCEECGGSGKKVISRKEAKDEGSVMFQQITVCPVCHGRGSIIDTPCDKCHGRGEIDREESLKVKIPKGAEEGMSLRISGHGLPSAEPGGPPGDLYVVIRTLPDDRFERVGADLWRTEVIEISDAVLGAEIEVPTLDKTITVKVPPGTQADEVLRIRGKGLPYFRDGRKGDLKLRIIVHIPKELSSEERRLYKELRELARGEKKKKSWWS